MSMHLEFEPHSWYRGFAIKKTEAYNHPYPYIWEAYTDDGMTYSIIERKAYTLKALKQQITEYRNREAARTAELYRRLK